jgi:hypothetical protein
MPFSHSSQITTIVEYIEKVNPRSILDVGIGMGQYGFLSRMNLENINLFNINGNQAMQKNKKEWHVRIDGIEGYPIYITPVHDYCYNKIMIGDALTLLPTLHDKSYELILAIDILEHFHKEDGVNFLSELKRISSNAILISTPKEFIHQNIEANPFENHRSVWSKNDLTHYGFPLILKNNISWINISEL